MDHDSGERALCACRQDRYHQQRRCYMTVIIDEIDCIMATCGYMACRTTGVKGGSVRNMIK